MAITIQAKFEVVGADAAAAAVGKTSNAFKGIQDQIKATESASGAMSSRSVQGLQALSQQSTRTAGDIARIKPAAESAATATATLSTSVRGLAGSLGLLTGVGLLVQLGKSFLTNALAMDSARLALTGVSGSVQAAAKEMTILNALADKAGIGITTLTQQWVGLQAAVSSVPGRLELARAVFSQLIETGARLGKSTDQVGNALYGLQQLAGGATVQLDELQKQMGDALPGLFPALAREMGMTTQEMRKLISEGKILVDDVLVKMPAAIKSLTSGEGSVTTATAEFGRMGTAWTQLMDTLAQSGALGLATGLVRGLTGAVKILTGVINEARAVAGGGEETTRLLLESTAIHKELQAIDRDLAKFRAMPQSERGDAVIQRTIDRQKELNDVLAASDKRYKELTATTAQAAAQKSPAESQIDAQVKLLTEIEKTPRAYKKAIAEIDAQLKAVKSGDARLLGALGLDPNDPQFKAQEQAFIASRVKARTELTNQLLGIDVRAGAKATKDAETEAKARARVEQAAMQESLKMQEALVAQSFDERRRVIDQKFSEDLAREPLRVKELSAVRQAELQAATVEEARFVEQIKLDSIDKQLLSEEEASAKREAIIKRRGEVELKTSDQTLQQEIKNAEELVSLHERVNEQILDRDQKMQEERTREVQRMLDQEAEAYRDFSNRIVSFIDEAFQGLLEGTLNAVQFFKRLLIQQLSSIAANVIGPLIAGISSTVLQGVAGFLPSGIGGAILQSAGLAVGGGMGAGGAGDGMSTLQGVGLLASMRTVAGAFTNGLAGLTNAMINAGSTVSTFFGGPALGTGFKGVEIGGAVDVGAGSAVGAGLGIAGGLAALGGGIYAALNASNAASKAAFAASAAAGAAATAVAAYGAITGAAVVTAAGTGWTGIGLIVAAVLAVIGTVLDKVIKPEGPTVAVGAPGGLNVGTADGKLQLQGDAGSRVFRREGVDREFARGIQAQLEEGITTAAIAAINTINAVALDPEAILGPTQAALQNALDNISTINSSNAKKMEQDITEQLRFANMQMVGGLLEPINLAFDQLRDMGDLEEQIQQLPGKTSGLLAIFTNLRTQLDEIGASRNTDVLRQLSAVRNQVENFGNRIAGTAAQVAESIVTQTIEAMKVDVAPKLADQITQFSGLMDESFRALNTLRATKTMLEGAGLPGGGVGQQADRLTMAMSEQAGRIATEIVTGALADLKTELDQVLVQPIAIQATTVNSLFTDSQAALAALWKEWHRLEEAGLDATAIQGQFERLLGGVIESTFTLLKDAFDPSQFSAFLAVLLSIPPELAKMNPELERLRNIGTTFAQVVGPNTQRIQALEASLRTPAQAAAASAQNIADLRSAIADAGDAADKALPLYGQLSAAIVANAELQIQAIQEIAQAWEQAMEQVDTDIATFEDALGGMGMQLTRAIVDMRVSADAFQQAVASGDTLGAIEAIQEYEQAIIAVAELQIQAIQEIAQAWQAAMDQVTSDIATFEQALMGVGDQLTTAIIDMRVNAAEFNQAVSSGDTLGAIKAIHVYEQAVIAVGELQIQQIQEHRQMTIDAQQAIIDGLQRHADAQQDVINAIDDQIDRQQDVIDAWQDQIDAQQDFMDGLQSIIQAHQDYADALKDIEQVQADRVDQLRQEAEALTSLRDRVDDMTRAALSPAQQQVSIRAGLAQTQGQLRTATGEDAIRLLEKLVSLNEELQQLGEQTDNLSMIKEGNDNLRVLQGELNNRLAGKTNELDLAFKHWDEARLTRLAAEAQVKALETQFKYQENVLKNLEARKIYEEHVRENLQIQRKYQENVLGNIETQIDDQRKVLANIENSRYWDEQIATVQASVLNELYNISRWLTTVQGPTTWEQQIAAVQISALNELYSIKSWLAGVPGPTTWEQQIADIQYAALIELRVIDQNLANIFRIMVGQSPIFAQRGGIAGLASGLHYAQGGMVPVMAEPGESYWSNLSPRQDRALESVNMAFPRFAYGGIVPGSGTGDTVPMFVQSGTRFVNSRATAAMGYQSGGQAPSQPTHAPENRTVHVHLDFRGAHFKNGREDANEIIRTVEEYFRRTRVDTRLR